MPGMKPRAPAALQSQSRAILFRPKCRL